MAPTSSSASVAQPRDTWFVELRETLRRFARGRLGGSARRLADTSDIVQDAIVRTLARLDVLQPRSHRALAAYLRAAVRSRIIDEYRRSRRWACTSLDDTHPDGSRSPLERAIDAQQAAKYVTALRRLSRRDRELLVGHLELGYTHAQLGCMIGRSPHAARMALTRAIARLAEQMAAE